jgi:hypothetical protein
VAVEALRCPCLRIVVIGEDADAQDAYNVWHAASEIEEAGALLVRPDGYIAWRVRGSAPIPPAESRWQPKRSAARPSIPSPCKRAGRRRGL